VTDQREKIAADFHRWEEKLLHRPRPEARALTMAVRTAEGALVWNDDDPGPRELLAPLLERLGRRTVLFARGAEPYGSVMGALTAGGEAEIHPRDFETRIFLMDLPVVRELSVASLVGALRRRRAVLVPPAGVVVAVKGDVTLASVLYSAVCFACYVKFLGDLLAGGPWGPLWERALGEVLSFLERRSDDDSGPLAMGPFTKAHTAVGAVIEAGRRVVEEGLVNASFGNVSYRLGGRIYISGRAAPLDELEGRVVAVDIAQTEEEAPGASTEYPTHRGIVSSGPYRAVLHGHPPFAVTLSMECPERPGCPARDDCGRFCPVRREVVGFPVVSGDAGGGPTGLSRTVPPAMDERGGVIVYGHGVFTAGRDDFRGALEILRRIEDRSRETLFGTLRRRGIL